ncbi:YwbE family protein [Bacillus thuringiensis]|uniref:YwbE family protein n=1 Tax=Bacillus thuringiensis TaxID=1428 RepID=UPI000BFE783B|nr:YwbE family protein [Bacillus thuringiensis]PGV84837.1 hypothetical protein COD85_19440 [Bacillus thuringiensis]
MLKKVLFSVLMGLCVIALSACKGEEEKVKETTDEQKIEEDKKVAEEEKRKQEEEQRAEEEKRKQEEEQKAEEEKRKQEERRKQEQQKAQQQQPVQQERTQKQENTKQITGGKPTRSQISVGSHVVIQLDNDYSKTVSGVVKDILTNTETHTYGIKVRLQNGQIGRVQSVG